jgi:uncharacterized protein
MAVALRREPSETAADIIAALASARTLPALSGAVERAAEIAPAVIDVIEQAARNVFLMPGQYNLLFWGIHAVAAARRRELHRPLINLVHQVQRVELGYLLGDAVRRTMHKLVISTFDGDPQPLIAACAGKNVDGHVRCHLMLALARLTFDGKIPRATTLEFLDRLEREPLAGPGDAAWGGWQDAIIYLGLEEMHERLCATWTDDRNPHEPKDRDELERLLAIAQALAPGDDTLFFEEDIVPLGNLRDDLEWITRPQYEPYEKEPDPNDPAGVFALKEFEIDWLDQFLGSAKVPPGTMTLEQVDGLFSALIAGPVGARFDDSLPMIWNGHATDAGPSYDSAEQEQYVQALLRRHWTTIGQRLDAAYLHVPLYFEPRDPDFGREWAGAFARGMRTRKTEWELRIGEESVGFFATMVMSLLLDQADAKAKGIAPEFRERMVEALPRGLIKLHQAWRGREDPFPATARAAEGRKVGRNERCPCGSGKKYKHCCGSPAKRPSS